MVLLKHIWQHKAPLAALLFWALLTLAYTLPFIGYGLFTGDGGLFALHAERLLDGKLPHVDFYAPYLGGDTVFHALCYLLFGKSLYALRLGLAGLTALFIVAIYFLSRQCLSRFWASVATLLVLSFTITKYWMPAGGWYALYFSVFSFLALMLTLKAPQNKQRAGFLCCGLLLGICFLMKHTIGLYTAFSIFMSLLLFGEVTRFPENLSPRLARWGQATALLGGAVMLAYTFSIIRPHLTLWIVGLFILPVVCILATLGYVLLKDGWKQEGYSLFLKRLLLVGTSCGLVLLAYGLPYLGKGAISTLLYRAFIFWPLNYLKLSSPIYDRLFSVPSFSLMVLLLISIFVAQKKPVFGALGFIGFLLSLQYVLGIKDWFAVYMSSYIQLPVWIAWSFLAWFFFRKNREYVLTDRVALALLFYGVLMCLNLYPNFNDAYFAASTAPILIVGIYLISRYVINASRVGKGILGLVLSVVLLLNLWLPYHIIRAEGWEFLTLPKGQVWVDQNENTRIQSILAFIQRYSQRPDDFYMLQDGVEIYFLSNHQNPAPYDHRMYSLESDGEDIIQALEKHQVRLIVHEPGYTSLMTYPLQPKLKEYIETNFQIVTMAPPYFIGMLRKP